ncbi:M48 family metallopeptidase [Solimonas sp. SE-A11]|uniref:M48 metallopeptidase family protein n=1 Tax=Solimonas sp. SE-A11 TaxID=3054954 RepID=UPI00259D1462|nr:YgjP-like metallopeptidase domain-containing protein [Solimonas sp. SE-A11]MDM4772313.1 DUF45 domain-containing protein [Solimonas sp. SE-A11]
MDAVLRRYLGAYPDHLQAQVRGLVEQGRLEEHLKRRYPGSHQVQSDGALHEYVQELKQAHMRSAPPLHKVQFQNKMDVLQNVLGLHTAISRIQGAKLKAKAEIRVSGLFKELAPEFLEMVVVHELAHLREREHNKAFYQLCRHMLPDYHQVEFDLRLVLLQRALPSASAEA